MSSEISTHSDLSKCFLTVMLRIALMMRTVFPQPPIPCEATVLLVRDLGADKDTVDLGADTCTNAPIRRSWALPLDINFAGKAGTSAGIGARIFVSPSDVSDPPGRFLCLFLVLSLRFVLVLLLVPSMKADRCCKLITLDPSTVMAFLRLLRAASFSLKPSVLSAKKRKKPKP